MNASQLFNDIETGALTEVESAACHYFDNARGLTAHQRFFFYPNDTIVCLTSVDGGNKVLALDGDDEIIFRSRNPMYFQ